jgi:4-hydroxy-tetrahydrodipicolinate reductase
MAAADAKPALMVNSCTGKMGRAVAEAALRAGLEVVPYTLCGAAELQRQGSIDVSGKIIELVGPDTRDELIEQLKKAHPTLIMVDYTLPDVIHDMANLYIKHKTPFVMGTTGGDRDKLAADVTAADLYAVIAPQMGKQVVAFQAMMEMMAQTFPGAFSGYNMRVTESHQSSKKDTSGTAKAIVGSFQKLGIDFNVSDIELVRDKESQVGRMAVPEEHLLGHAYHTYHLDSPDGTVSFEFQHNVCGRTIYAEGTVDAALFLARQIQNKASQKLYNMVDVLRAGAMR